MSTKNRKIIVVLVILLILIVAGIITAAYLSTENISEETEPDTQSQPMYTSMEDGETVTQSDIEQRRQIEDTARQAALDYFNQQYPDYQSVAIDSIEWYFTDVNESDNILVTVTTVSEDGFMSRQMRVIEIDINDQGQTTVLSTYPPDERYSIYD